MFAQVAAIPAASWRCGQLVSIKVSRHGELKPGARPVGVRLRLGRAPLGTALRVAALLARRTYS